MTETTTLRETARAAIEAQAQEIYERETAPNYHTLMAATDGTLYWREETDQSTHSIAEHYNRQRDHWGLGMVNHSGGTSDEVPAWEDAELDSTQIADMLERFEDGLDAIPVGFFADEDTGEEWAAMPTD